LLVSRFSQCVWSCAASLRACTRRSGSLTSIRH
jgi:hypothetical protein